MKCAVCGADGLVHATRDVEYTYKDRTTVIPSVTGDFCQACGEVMLDLDEAERFSARTKAFHQQVDVG